MPGICPVPPALPIGIAGMLADLFPFRFDPWNRDGAHGVQTASAHATNNRPRGWGVFRAVVLGEFDPESDGIYRESGLNRFRRRFILLPPVLQGAGYLASPRRPIMQCRWIEIRAVGPNQRVNLAIQLYLFKQAQVAQRPIKLALEDGAEINFPEQAVVKANTQGIRPNNGKRLHFANSVPHNVCG